MADQDLYCFHIKHFVYVQSIASNYSVDSDQLASSEVGDQDLYCFHIIHFVYVQSIASNYSVDPDQLASLSITITDRF